ncbi:MAG: heavy-metal-associated domain-containing protein [Deltaproteobacteria bacterium]|nr:heavy-metal-associated domain-containing protein [Deltaproteobacteria bacterium]
MNDQTTERETLLNVTGMTCASCARHVDQALRALEGVSAVEVRLREGQVRVTHDERPVPEAMIAAVEEAGYAATPR